MTAITERFLPILLFTVAELSAEIFAPKAPTALFTAFLKAFIFDTKGSVTNCDQAEISLKTV